jgi:hypothetical protein
MAGTDPPTPHDPRREDELAERGRVLVAAAVAETSAPVALRARVEELRRGREQARPSTRRRWLGLAASFAAVAAAAVAALVISLGGASAPSVLATVSLAGPGPNLPAPKPDPNNDALLQTRIDGLPFPDWGPDFDWRAVGARQDEIEGRRATTVYYDTPRGARAAYTILGGDTIKVPADARAVRIRGDTYHVMNRGDRRIVVWNRDGHTCVMSAPMSVPESRLVFLAAWDDGGNVPF